MLKRNVNRWLSVKKLVCLPLSVVLVLIASSAQAQWMLVDNFEGRTVDTMVEGTTGGPGATGPGVTWTGNTSATYTFQEDPVCDNNMAMEISGGSNPDVLRASLPANIAAGSTGTVFYRFRTPAAGGTTDLVVGLTDDSSITNLDFKAGVRHTVSGGAYTLEKSDGADFEEVVTLNDNTWYNVWIVATNSNPGSFFCFLQSDTDVRFLSRGLVPIPSGGLFDFRINENTDIINIDFRTDGIAGNSLFIDDIYINPSESDFTTPSGVVPCICSVSPGLGAVRLGDVTGDGDVNFMDIAAFIEVLQKQEFLIEADCNQDGSVNFLDIAPFIQILSACR